MILEQIARDTKIRVTNQKKKVPLGTLKKTAYSMETETGFPFEKALAKEGLSFICEVKKASPSKGIIAEDFPYLDIAREYEVAGADAISCLTEPKYFLGRDSYLKEIAETVKIPVLRKDFVVIEDICYFRVTAAVRSRFGETDLDVMISVFVNHNGSCLLYTSFTPACFSAGKLMPSWQ